MLERGDRPQARHAAVQDRLRSAVGVPRQSTGARHHFRDRFGACTPNSPGSLIGRFTAYVSHR
jgi:hypothetical protein